MRFSGADGTLKLIAGVGVALLAVWLLYKTVSAASYLVVVVLLGFATYWIARPELQTVFRRRGDNRPWLVRLREHRWRPLMLPGGYRVPRWAAYLAVAVAWRWVL
ncbi:MAG: hypothetical protein AAGG46_05885 [Planctomycetota bacterium]